MACDCYFGSGGFLASPIGDAVSFAFSSTILEISSFLTLVMSVIKLH